MCKERITNVLFKLAFYLVPFHWLSHLASEIKLLKNANQIDHGIKTGKLNDFNLNITRNYTKESRHEKKRMRESTIQVEKEKKKKSFNYMIKMKRDLNQLGYISIHLTMKRYGNVTFIHAHYNAKANNRVVNHFAYKFNRWRRQGRDLACGRHEFTFNT